MAETKNKTEEILHRLKTKIDEEGKDPKTACRDLQRQMDISNGYAHEIFNKYLSPNQEPTTEVQKAVVQAFREDSNRTYAEIADRVKEIVGEKPTESIVSDYTTRYCNDLRHSTMDIPQLENGEEDWRVDDQRITLPKNVEEVEDIDVDEVDNAVDKEESVVNEEENVTDEEENLVTITLNEEEAFNLGRFLIEQGEFEEVAKTVMKQY